MDCQRKAAIFPQTKGTFMADPILYLISIVPLSIPTPSRPGELPFSWPEPNGNGDQIHEAAPAPPTRNAWLFQSNPLLYDLRGALRSLGEQAWSVSRYARRIMPGDRVYLWEASRWGGIAGVAEIKESARVRPEPPQQIPFARAREVFARDRPKAVLKILRVLEPPIARSNVIATPELRDLGVLRCPRGTNFRLTVDQWHAMNNLIASECRKEAGNEPHL